ncbi:MAG: hypothetical protein EON61_23435 [Alphaproteobacteria bacterium]|nr:MAG: hypothetical protein EON61_23435 [Alphaproteobacteria bacterium]
MIWLSYKFGTALSPILVLHHPLIPAQAGIQSGLFRCVLPWVPACAGMTMGRAWAFAVHPTAQAPMGSGRQMTPMPIRWGSFSGVSACARSTPIEISASSIWLKNWMLSSVIGSPSW